MAVQSKEEKLNICLREATDILIKIKPQSVPSIKVCKNKGCPVSGKKNNHDFTVCVLSEVHLSRCGCFWKGVGGTAARDPSCHGQAKVISLHLFGGVTQLTAQLLPWTCFYKRS